MVWIGDYLIFDMGKAISTIGGSYRSALVGLCMRVIFFLFFLVLFNPFSPRMEILRALYNLILSLYLIISLSEIQIGPSSGFSSFYHFFSIPSALQA